MDELRTSAGPERWVETVREAAGVEWPTFVWLPRLGMGYYPVSQERWPYDDAYFKEYERREQTEIGRLLNAFRVDLVQRHIGNAPLLDFGVGNGAFIKARGGRTYGFDVNPAARRWLRVWHLYRESPGDGLPNVSFWDSLEHLPEPALHLESRETVFVSTPIYRDVDHALGSKHMKPDEHYWYWTEDGLLEWFSRRGFLCVERSDGETVLGREDIRSFVFRRNGS